MVLGLDRLFWVGRRGLGYGREGVDQFAGEIYQVLVLLDIVLEEETGLLAAD